MSAYQTILSQLTPIVHNKVEYRIGFVEVNAELARQLLDEANTHNRPLGRADVKKYAQLMITGEWEINGETLILDTKGRLINGQHRLHAVIEAATTEEGVDQDFTITFLIVSGVKPRAFDTLDQGRVRTLAHVLAVDGEEHAKHLAGALRFLHNRLSGRSAGAGGKFTTFSAKQTLKDHQGLHDSLTYFLGSKDTGGLQQATEENPECEIAISRLTGSLANAAVIRYLQLNSGATPEQVDEFWRGFAYGVEEDGTTPLPQDDPRRRLRIVLMKSNDSANKLDRSARPNIIIKAWLAFQAGETLSKLSIGKNEVPRMGGLDVDPSEVVTDDADDADMDVDPEEAVKAKIKKKRKVKKAEPSEETQEPVVEEQPTEE